jgi:hypothetical protein
LQSIAGLGVNDQAAGQAAGSGHPWPVVPKTASASIQVEQESLGRFVGTELQGDGLVERGGATFGS